MVKLDDLSLRTLAPPSIKNDKDIQAILAALDPVFSKLNKQIDDVLIYSRLDELPENILDILAWQWHVDFYELAKSLSAKRELVKNSIEWHKHKGTAYAIIQALDYLGVEGRFTPWYEEDAEPYTFAIDAKLRNEFWERVDWTKTTLTIRRAITESKAARSYMSRIYVWFEDNLKQHATVKMTTPQGIFRRVALNQPHAKKLAHAIHVNSLPVQGHMIERHKIAFKNENFSTHAIDIANTSGRGIFEAVKLNQPSTRQAKQDITFSNKATRSLIQPVLLNRKRESTLKATLATQSAMSFSQVINPNSKRATTLKATLATQSATGIIKEV